MAINQSILIVEKILPDDRALYSIQKDGCGMKEEHSECKLIERPDGKAMKMVRPSRAVLLLQEGESEHCLVDYSPRYLFSNPEYFSLPINACSSLTVLYIAKFFGCDHVDYICCDAAVTGNCHSYVPDTDGELNMKTSGTVYLTMRKDVEEHAQIIGMKRVTWRLPANY